MEPASAEPAHFRERHLENVSYWLEENSKSSDSLLPIGPEFLSRTKHPPFSERKSAWEPRLGNGTVGVLQGPGFGLKGFEPN